MRQQMLQALGEQRWIDFENGMPEYTPPLSAQMAGAVPEGMEGTEAALFSYYGLVRGHHPDALDGTTATSMYSWINFHLMNYIEQISLRPILFIIGDIAHFRAFSKTA